MSLASVLDLVTEVCLLDRQCTAPVSPITTQLPVCDLKSVCTPNAASTKTLTRIPSSPGLSTTPLSFVRLIYLTSLASFPMSSAVHLVTRVARNDTAVRHSGLVLFSRYSNFATML